MNKNLLKAIETAIINNKDLVDKPYIHQTDKGYMKSKDKEILVSITKKYYGGCFYAHTFKDRDTQKWISLIAWRKNPKQKLSKQTNKLFFKNYSKGLSNLEYAPCAIQNEDDAFKLNDTFDDACKSLKPMIDIFEIKERLYDNEDVFYSKNPTTRFDMRIYKVYY